MPLVNHTRIKRDAHLLGRTDSGWPNPFAHTWSKKKQIKNARSHTWDGASLEAQDANDDLSPVTHAQTEPGLSQRPTSEEEYSGPSFSKRDEATGVDPSQPESGRTAVDTPLAQSPVLGQDGAVRQRNGKALGSKEEQRGNDADGELDANGKKKQKHRMFKDVQPKEPYTVANQLRRTLLNSWINLLLVAAPVGIALNYVPAINKVVVFVVNFIAIIPLAAMLSFATEEIALRTGETLGGLLNATFGNAVELIVAIIALTQKDPKVIIVQTSLIGSILSNLLLVLGMCFFFGGLRRQEQFFNTTVAQTAASMLALAVASIIVPTVFDANNGTGTDSTLDVAALSRGTAVILLIVYAAYLFFQLKTHHLMFAEESQKVPAKPYRKALKPGAIGQAMVNPAGMMANGVSDQEELRKTMMNLHPKEDDDEGEDPQLHFWVAIATLSISTVIIALCAEFMVGSIDAVTKSGHGISEEFVGLILLPIVGNAAEHATAVTVAIKDKMDLAIGVAVGSSMQVALFLIPLLVIIGWGMGIDNMTLSFDVFQVAVLFVSVLLVNYLIGDGKSHWLEGQLLVCLYLIIAVCAWCKLKFDQACNKQHC
ncbi:Calcium/proton exchanger [Coniochaeta ligniaria NRRL 30616]|uniref:Calcium/proton exchanger n=1 Tax=Coniochaeta ligniaria NRRL 30616 TaxID=1408157 RepID=A0A1J7JQ38_9PEZI|nr:Calcium/proton exchanger [Coniochaeta ligniaria NRRL 30616]